MMVVAVDPGPEFTGGTPRSSASRWFRGATANGPVPAQPGLATGRGGDLRTPDLSSIAPGTRRSEEPLRTDPSLPSLGSQLVEGELREAACTGSERTDADEDGRKAEACSVIRHVRRRG